MTETLSHRLFKTAISVQALFCVVFILLVMSPVDGYSGQWRVAPARIYLDRDLKSSVITVVNDGDEKIDLQGKAMAWSQDEQGKDIYRESNDLVFFPRILMIGKGGQRIIRIGIKNPEAAQEKTYRLFIEEIPPPRKNPLDSAQLTVAVRFGIPVFVKPLKEEVKGEIAHAELKKGRISMTVRNTGNTHFRITDITMKGRDGTGAETFATKLNGWYLLADAAREYAAPVPQDKCVATSHIEITVSTDENITLTGNVNVEKTLCLP